MLLNGVKCANGNIRITRLFNVSRKRHTSPVDSLSKLIIQLQAVITVPVIEYQNMSLAKRLEQEEIKENMITLF